VVPEPVCRLRQREKVLLLALSSLDIHSIDKCFTEWVAVLCKIYSCHVGGCIQKIPDWSPGARTANDTALRN